ncbi:MAG: hypothetical protein J6W60_13755 [Treponema sp.]|nr:hypothetical protein [Treponema sp.]MBP5442553.1 hypothetical protein [Treponema sp.]MBP5753903.1 hypothetical protein [Treponema sp.]
MFVHKKFAAATAIFLLVTSSCFSDVSLSTKTKSLLDGLMDLKVELFSYKSPKESLDRLESWRKGIQADYESLGEVDQMVLTNMIDCEIYNYKSQMSGTKKELNALLSAQAKKCKDFYDEHKNEKMDVWIPLSCGSAIAVYMALEPLKTAFTYGYVTRDLFQLAVDTDPNFSHALRNLAQWYYYCPGFLGGSKKKAKELFNKAYKAGKIRDDKFENSILLSQLAFDDGDNAGRDKYMAEARTYSKVNSYLDFVDKINASGESIFKYHGHKADE